MRKEIENRLIDFSVDVINLSKSMGNDFADKHMANQIIRSSTSAALNYGEAQGAESRNDFIHKASVVLKELRETHVNLIIIFRSKLTSDKKRMDHLLDESNQLVAIFQKTVMSARKNRKSTIGNRKSTIKKKLFCWEKDQIKHYNFFQKSLTNSFFFVFLYLLPLT